MTGTLPSDLRSWLALIRAPGLGASGAARLVARFGDAAALLDAGPAAWTAAGVPAAVQQGLLRPDRDGVERDLRWLEGDGCSLVTCVDARYPALLREIAHAPVALFCQGDAALLTRPQVAVIGARAATPQGLETAAGFAAELTRHGLLVTSGLALGIDGAAHRGALGAGGGTVAVCATGLDRVYPRQHRELAREIAARGLLVSEFPTGVPPLAEHFPMRNRLISGLALGVLVVEAARRSGSLITARLALDQGREVFAVPGSIHNVLARGTHALIRQGAKLTETVADVLEELAPLVGDALRALPARVEPGEPLEPLQQRVLEALGFDATPFDRLVERLAMPVDALSSALLALELQGCVAAVPGGAFQRVAARGIGGHAA